MLLWIDARKERAALKTPAYNGNSRLASPYNLNGYKMR
jgi:hypothetical protein